MVNYVCRTCLYVCDNEFSFRRLEKVKQVLELFVPEINIFVGKYSLICEQCYYFLKNVEKFKIKCIETQKKLYSMNIETIKDTHNAVLKSVAKEVPLRDYQIDTLPNFTVERVGKPRLKRSSENRPEKVSKSKDVKIPKTSTFASNNEITLTSLLNSSARPLPALHKQIGYKKNETTLFNTTVADDLLQLFSYREDIIDLKGFREFAVKGFDSNKVSEDTRHCCISKENSKELIINYEEDEYMTRHDLVSAGVLSDDMNKSGNVEPEAVKGLDSEKESEDTSNCTIPKENCKELALNYEEDEYMTRNDLVSAGILSDDSSKSAYVEPEAVKDLNSNKQSEDTSTVLKENSKELTMNYEEDEYMTRNDLVSAGVLSDDSNNSANVEQEAEPDSEEDLEMVELTISDDSTSSGENAGRVEIKISNSPKQRKVDGESKEQVAKPFKEVISSNESDHVSIPMTAKVKKEIVEDKNPGFFNKQSTDGYYKCRLCTKQYKTSKRLHSHTKKIHGDELKFHHCKNCSFFTLWKTSLLRHYSSFHAEIFEKNNATLANCYHCSFQTRSKDELSRHILNNHVNEKFERCGVCRLQFSDSISYAEHVKKEHLSLGAQQNSSCCIDCNKLFLSNGEYKKHIHDQHQTPLDGHQES